MIGFTLILSRLLTAISTLLGVLLSISVPTYAAISTCEESIQKTVRIGIEETLDPEFFVETMGPTMAHLRAVFPNVAFKTETLSMEALSEVIREKRIDFFMSDSGLYAYEARTHGAKDIAVRTRPLAKDPSKASSSVVIVRADRHDLKVFEDLKGTTVVAESPKSFEGWLIIQAVLADKGFNPTNFWGKRLFTEYRSPNAAELVLAGEADVGILKACDFEQLLTSRNFRSSALRVIEAQKTDGLACLRSAPLYPNVVFASTSGGDPSFLKKLTMALLNQPPSHKGFSWGAAGDFVGVDQLYRSLKLGPYAYLRELNWQAVREEYLPHLLGFAGLIAALLIHSVYTKILVNVRTRQLRETLARQLDLEKEARISRTRLSQMERAGIVSQLSGMLAHEMLQPVTSILNFAGGLRMCVNQRFQEDPAICRASEAISEEAHRIAAIVERVRSYAKDEDSPRICLKASTALEAALKTFQHSSTSEEVRTRVVIKHNPLIEVNKLEIELVLFNLMKNSAAAMADAPSMLTTDNTPGSTGEMLEIAVRDCRAKLIDMAEIQCLPGCPADRKHRVRLHNDVSRFIFVDPSGRRFCREDERRDVLRDTVLSLPGGIAYSITDAAGLRSYDILIQKEAVLGVETGDAWSSSTLEGLAKMMKLPPKAVVSAVADYNDGVHRKCDRFGKSPRELRHLIVEPPFWGCYAAMTIHYTMGGLKISPQAQVLDDADQIIPGLYAAGEAASGIHGINRMGANGINDALVFGTIAGREAALCG